MHDHTYCTKVDGASQSDVEKPDLQDKLKRKIRCLQQQLRCEKAKQQTMADLIQELQQKLILRPEDAEYMHAKFDDETNDASQFKCWLYRRLNQNERLQATASTSTNGGPK